MDHAQQLLENIPSHKHIIRLIQDLSAGTTEGKLIAKCTNRLENVIEKKTCPPRSWETKRQLQPSQEVERERKRQRVEDDDLVEDESE